MAATISTTTGISGTRADDHERHSPRSPVHGPSWRHRQTIAEPTAPARNSKTTATVARSPERIIETSTPPISTTVAMNAKPPNGFSPLTRATDNTAAETARATITAIDAVR